MKVKLTGLYAHYSNAEIERVYRALYRLGLEGPKKRDQGICASLFDLGIHDSVSMITKIFGLCFPLRYLDLEAGRNAICQGGADYWGDGVRQRVCKTLAWGIKHGYAFVELPVYCKVRVGQNVDYRGKTWKWKGLSSKRQIPRDTNKQ